MKKILLMLTLVASFITTAQTNNKLNFSNTYTHDPLISSFIESNVDSGYFEFVLKDNKQIDMLHLHDSNNTNCYSSDSIQFVKTKYLKDYNMVFDEYKSTDVNGNTSTFYLFMDRECTTFNILLMSNKQTKIYKINTFQVTEQGRVKDWFINKSLTDVKNIINE